MFTIPSYCWVFASINNNSDTISSHRLFTCAYPTTFSFFWHLFVFYYLKYSCFNASSSSNNHFYFGLSRILCLCSCQSMCSDGVFSIMFRLSYLNFGYAPFPSRWLKHQCHIGCPFGGKGSPLTSLRCTRSDHISL